MKKQKLGKHRGRQLAAEGKAKAGSCSARSVRHTATLHLEALGNPAVNPFPPCLVDTPTTRGSQRST